MNDTEFPELSRFDPVAQAIGIRPGQVCKITRSSKTAIEAPYYRICFQNNLIKLKKLLYINGDTNINKTSKTF